MEDNSITGSLQKEDYIIKNLEKKINKTTKTFRVTCSNWVAYSRNPLPLKKKKKIPFHQGKLKTERDRLVYVEKDSAVESELSREACHDIDFLCLLWAQNWGHRITLSLLLTVQWIQTRLQKSRAASGFG